MLPPDSKETLQVKNSEEVLQADENTTIKGRQALLPDYISQKEREMRQMLICLENRSRAIYLLKNQRNAKKIF